MTRTEIIMSVIQAYLKTPYKWGGADPDGIDCSGLVQEILWSVGMLPDKIDRTAQGLYYLYKVSDFILWDKPVTGFGHVVFFNKTGSPRNRITHCEFVVSSLPKLISLGARGGRFTKGRVMYREVEGRTNMKIVAYADTLGFARKMEE